MNELYNDAAAIAHSEYVRTGVMPDIGQIMRDLEEEEAVISAAGAGESEEEGELRRTSEFLSD